MSAVSEWRDDLDRWLQPFLAGLPHPARRAMCPLYVAGLIGLGDRKSVQPMAARGDGVPYDRLHHFIAAGIWDETPLQQAYRPTGPALLSTADMAGILGHVLGRRVRPVPMPLWLFLKAARRQGASGYEMSVFRHYVEDHRQGAFALGAPSDDILRATGRPAETFEETARRYVALPEAQRGLGATARAAAAFVAMPFLPGYDLARIDRRLAFPEPASPRFAMQDESWQGERRRRTMPGQRAPVTSGAVA